VSNMPRRDRWTASALVIAAVAIGSLGDRATLAAEPSTLEDIPGSKVKRVVLTQKAAERLAIQTEPVREEPVERWMMVSGEVEVTTGATAASSAAMGVGSDADAAPVVVRVPLPSGPDEASRHANLVLSIGDVKGYDKEAANQGQVAGTPEGAFVLPIGGDQAPIPVKALPGSAAEQGSATRARYYEISDPSAGLKPGQDVRVGVRQPGSGSLQKVVPYSALLYDAHGATWVYTNPEPLAFVRQAVDVEYVEGDAVILEEGSTLSGAVVTAGAAELMGVEQKFGGGKH
jgi:hypothetical protein